jgi:hypothetical protein
MKKAIVLLLALFVLAGCAQQAVQETTTTKTTTQKQTTTEVIEVEEKDTGVLSDEIKTAVDSQLGPGVKYAFPLRYAQLSPGEKFAFGLGLQNTRNKETLFRIEMGFDKANDKMMNPISTDEDTMNSWIKTNFDEFSLAKEGKKTITIVMEAGDIKPGVEAVPGSYIFDLEVFYADSGTITNDEYTGKMEITVKVV